MAIQDQIPRSRLTLTYKTEVDGQPAIVDLPLRLLIMGDFSQGSSKDREVDFDERRLRQLTGDNLNDLMEDMGIRLKFSVPNRIDPDKGESVDVDLPITSMRSFSPDEFAMNIPKLKGLVVLKRLLEQVQADISNRKKFRKLLSELYSNEDALKKLMDEFKGFEDLRVPKPQESAS